MPPYSSKNTSVTEIQSENENLGIQSDAKEKREPKRNWRNLWCYFGNQGLKWLNICVLFLTHLYTFYLICSMFLNYYIYSEKGLPEVLLWSYLYSYFPAFGVTAGAHRLFTHRCYKAKFPLRIILVIGYLASGMNPIFEWVRDHRVHHKFSDTDADPHNASRGFFFSHCGWLMMKKHPEVIKQGNKIDMSDILEDPAVKFQQKFYLPLMILMTFLVPSWIPWYFWNLDFIFCLKMSLVRWVITLNAIWAVNSAAHIWGTRPYDKNLYPVENKWVSFWTSGEGWHNYHHTFPWDYKAAELTWFLNTTAILLNIFAYFGWAYDLKTPSKELIEKVVRRSGDGSHYKWGKEVPESEGSIVTRRKTVKN